MDKKRDCIAIDLKSFYASVECMDRGLDPMDTHLVVADESRTEKTICLAVSPSMKSYGIPGRARLFEVNQRMRAVNANRLEKAPGKAFTGESHFAKELDEHPEWKAGFLIAPPRMAHYMEISTRIYSVYTRFVSPEDIHVYSIDEVFMDVTDYLKTYHCTARELAMRMIRAVLSETGITATAGVGTNLYLAKVAMDIVAKHIPPDENGVRIAELDEISYRKTLWSHRPLTDFWRLGRGYEKKLNAAGLYTMGDIARCSLGGNYSAVGEDQLFRLFGINAELLIDHAWGVESCTIRDIKAYVPKDHSLNRGQVLPGPYEADKARLVVQEMADALALELVEKRLLTDQMALTVGYDREALKDPARMAAYRGTVEKDRYGRMAPKPAYGSINLASPVSSSREIVRAVLELYDRIVHPSLLVRRMYLAANRVIREEDQPTQQAEQLDMFTDYEEENRRREEREKALEKEKQRQMAVLRIQKKFGKNAILKGMNYEEGATARERNAQIGGHKA